LPLIELTHVSKIYDLGEVKVEALVNATLNIEQGEFVALIGPSGSGKSTLMNTLGCLDRPTHGSYRLAGDEVSTMSRDERATIRNRRIGFVFQNFNLLARTSALENEPSILMGDEPTGNLDTRTSREVIALFRQLNEEQAITVILVTHDQDVARNARRTIVLRDGHVVADTSDFAQAIQALHSAAEEEPLVQAEPAD
jgi:putative ABC transport system ATP-binding protein